MVVSGLPTIQMLFRSIIFAAAVQALFQISLHQIWKKNNQNDFWLMLWLFLLSLQLFFYYDSLRSSPLLNGYFGIVGFSIPLLSAPIMYQYIVQLSIGGKINSCRLAFYIVPWLVYLLLALSLKYFNPADIFMQFGYPHFSTQVSSLVIYFLQSQWPLYPESMR